MFTNWRDDAVKHICHDSQIHEVPAQHCILFSKHKLILKNDILMYDIELDPDSLTKGCFVTFGQLIINKNCVAIKLMHQHDIVSNVSFKRQTLHEPNSMETKVVYYLIF